ncbi:transmembrane protein, putative (macronuclear) [Tetrahymena thermophila SB210]|uniref:Transmembrane protein, putative n=1 Tax=Tetrahymena thermophila (strain SB210) TaxID=312017 RepID=I7LUU1_TETTS|nr:transmembrane protein, putative [Tetrahymena thermophila SB210]EAR96044.2 transmembrane protein, putative [Tetrahymena thermophila SB210]|eukprot:XP_001016289.2 transmembrane protein, putative [Tetrahymena thermophila SB210]
MGIFSLKTKIEIFYTYITDDSVKIRVNQQIRFYNSDKMHSKLKLRICKSQITMQFYRLKVSFQMAKFCSNQICFGEKKKQLWRLMCGRRVNQDNYQQIRQMKKQQLNKYQEQTNIGVFVRQFQMKENLRKSRRKRKIIMTKEIIGIMMVKKVIQIKKVVFLNLKIVFGCKIVNFLVKQKRLLLKMNQKLFTCFFLSLLLIDLLVRLF